ncbi:alpha/beta hydrolase [Candidatus Woesearchaeota archaeon]|nr:alpha/beta hydrolase [Candidatus Woesearchaeota archaeon]MCF7901255.1 alpha/beta hydrolase [Candidatus Woesearchaeota archaeon]MCF8012838.1 alpha/beta hydrolase [Candidatus Woesearchaeota archaeon]
MTKIFLIHGAFGNPKENWFPWLKQKLEELNHEVIVPEFPTPENQSLENWNTIFAEYENQIDENTIFVGHSLAPAFLLSVLEHINVTIKGSYFISGFLKLLGNETFDSINRTFVDKTFDWSKIKQNCKQFFIYHSDNDPYVPIECANELADKLGAIPNIIKNAGHFNEEAGYIEFEELFNNIKPLL